MFTIFLNTLEHGRSDNFNFKSFIRQLNFVFLTKMAFKEYPDLQIERMTQSQFKRLGGHWLPPEAVFD